MFANSADRKRKVTARDIALAHRLLSGSGEDLTTVANRLFNPPVQTPPAEAKPEEPQPHLLLYHCRLCQQKQVPADGGLVKLKHHAGYVCQGCIRLNGGLDKIEDWIAQRVDRSVVLGPTEE